MLSILGKFFLVTVLSGLLDKDVNFHFCDNIYWSVQYNWILCIIELLSITIFTKQIYRNPDKDLNLFMMSKPDATVWDKYRKEPDSTRDKRKYTYCKLCLFDALITPWMYYTKYTLNVLFWNIFKYFMNSIRNA